MLSGKNARPTLALFYLSLVSFFHPHPIFLTLILRVLRHAELDSASHSHSLMRSWSLRTTGSQGSFLACSLCQRVQDDVGGEGLMRFFASLRMTWGCEALASHFPHSAILLSLVYFLHPHPIFLTLILRVEKSPLPSSERVISDKF